MLLNYLFPCLCSRGATFPGCCTWRENMLRLLTFLILLVPLPIRAPWSGVVRRPILECFHYEFIHILPKPHCSYLQEYTPYIFMMFATWYFKIVTATFPCAPHPKLSLESPQSPQPQPSTPSTHPNLHLASAARLQSMLNSGDARFTVKLRHDAVNNEWPSYLPPSVWKH